MRRCKTEILIKKKETTNAGGETKKDSIPKPQKPLLWILFHEFSSFRNFIQIHEQLTIALAVDGFLNLILLHQRQKLIWHQLAERGNTYPATLCRVLSSYHAKEVKGQYIVITSP